MNRERLGRGAMICTAAFVAMLVFWRQPFLQLSASGFGDWTWFHHMWEAGRVAILRWHEAPLWDPHHCGGVSLWGNPQAQVFSPTYLLLGLPFGTTVGHKLYLLLHAVAGWAGMYLVGRRLFSISPIAAAFAATVWCASGFFAWHGSIGHATYLCFYFAPFLLLAWRAAAGTFRHVTGVAALMVLTIAEGGHYAFPFFVVLLGQDLLVRVFTSRTRTRLLGAAVGSVVLTGTLGAFRFVPVLETVTEFPKRVVDTDFLTMREIVVMLTRRAATSLRFGDHIPIWPEYATFVGWTVLALFLIGLGALLARLLGGRFERWAPRLPKAEVLALLVGLVVFLLLTQGVVSRFHPWALLQKLPLYGSLRIPSRWVVMLTFYVVLIAGVGLDALGRSLAAGARHLRGAFALTMLPAATMAAVALAAIVDLYVVNHAIYRWAGSPLGKTRPEARFYLVQGRDYFAELGQYPGENVGTDQCYDPVPWRVSPLLRLGRVPQAIIEPAASGAVVDWGRTSLTVWADVQLGSPGVVRFNQNIASGWISDQGTVVDDGGLLAVQVAAPMRGRVTARFRPPDLPYAVGVSVLSALACALIACGFPRRRHPRT